MGGPDNHFAQTPKPPYVAVIFTSLRTKADNDGYQPWLMRWTDWRPDNRAIWALNPPAMAKGSA